MPFELSSLSKCGLDLIRSSPTISFRVSFVLNTNTFSIF
jgi:hypothetical protein